MEHMCRCKVREGKLCVQAFKGFRKSPSLSCLDGCGWILHLTTSPVSSLVLQSEHQNSSFQLVLEELPNPNERGGSSQGDYEEVWMLLQLSTETSFEQRHCQGVVIALNVITAVSV